MRLKSGSCNWSSLQHELDSHGNSLCLSFLFTWSSHPSISVNTFFSLSLQMSRIQFSEDVPVELFWIFVLVIYMLVWS